MQKPSDKPEREGLLNREIPFGIFLGFCSLLAIFIGSAVWKWYFNFLR